MTVVADPSESELQYRAALWFTLHRMVDQRAPRKWRWGDLDHWANEILNAPTPDRTDLPREGQHTIRAWDWPSEDVRPDFESNAYFPNYFPDAVRDPLTTLHKQTTVLWAEAEAFRLMDHLVSKYAQPLPEAEWIPPLSGDECYVSPSQYLGYPRWLAETAEDFAEDVDGRKSHFETWAISGITRDPVQAAELVGRGISTYRIGPPAVGSLMRVVLGPVL